MTDPLMNEDPAIETLLTDAPPLTGDESAAEDPMPAPAPRVRRNLPQMMRRIPVTLTREVGSARVSLQDLLEIGPDSVVELDTLAGEPLVVKGNGTPIGRAEVVVSGENYGLKVLDIDGLDFDSLNA